ncbi:MAG: CHAT domain-containing protein [Spirulina sp. SIO3F2]|nr:CHAT domain-containing protein [Spirulina sp. SIO3F2]
MQQPSPPCSNLLHSMGLSTLLILATWNWGALSAVGQSITATPDGTGTVIQHNGSTYHIEGGTQAGANLFHSFQDFGLSPGEIANFLSNPSIINILGRVTGGHASIIDGLLQVSGSNTNLYLMNPAGIVFGANASLNVSGDFFATTADRIGFEEGWFSATGTNDYTQLFGTPNQFAFLRANPSAILNQGQLQTNGDLSLIGGTVQNQGAMVSTHGNVTLAAVPGTRLVNLAQPGMLLSLDLPGTALDQGISPLDLPTLLTGPVGDVAISGTVQGEQIDLYAAGQVIPSDPNLVQGETRVIRFSETGKNPKYAVFIDRRADHPEALLYGAEAGTVAQIIEPDEDGIAVISGQLAVISESVGALESVAIAAEGNAGNFWLGSAWITSETVLRYQKQLQSLHHSLTDNADLLLYSCFTALGATGEALITTLADFTGADVAASVDVTGNSLYGGNWDLETSTGSIDASHPFTAQTLTHWDGKLATLTVQNIGDNLTVDGSLTFREALQASNLDSLVDGQMGTGTDTIMFDTGGVFVTPQTITTTMGQFDISDDVVIQGTGQTQLYLNGGGANKVFNITANNATFENLTIENGNGTEGAGIGVAATATGTLTLDNVTVRNSISTTSGGAIDLAVGGFGLSSFRLINSSITGNQGFDGGGIDGRTSGSIYISDSNISNNTALGSAGGMLLNGAAGATIRNSTISNNSASVAGGGILSVAPLNIIASNISNNIAASDDGGGIRADSDITLTNSTVSGNSSAARGGGIDGNASIILNNSTISNNLSSNNGGGFFATTSATINDSTISGNSSAAQGGGIYNNGNSTLNNSTISGNSSVGLGAGIRSVGDVNLYNLSVISGNSSGDSGAGIASSGDVGVIDSTISNNSSNNRAGGILSNMLTLTNSTITNNSANANGGGAFVTSTVTLNNSIVSSNSSGGLGAGIRSVGGVNLYNSSVIGNSGISRGGGIFDDAGVSLINSTVANNLANAQGGGIFSYGLVTVNNSTVSGNSSAAQGGGIYGSANVALNNATISSNLAGNHGGGLFATTGATITDSIITNNSSAVNGGGVNSAGDVALNNTTVVNNTSLFRGGGIVAQGTNLSLSITNSTITNNQTTTSNDGGVSGFVGAGGTVTITNSVISGNRSLASSTGGLFSQGNLTLTDSTIYDNSSANLAGGIVLGANTVATITNTTLFNNSSGNNGGGILGLAGVQLSLSNATLSGNSSGNNGGGIFTNTGAQLNLTNATIAFNNASGDGGGIFTTNDAAHSIVNTIIANNSGAASNAPDFSGNFASANFRHNLILSTAGITAGAPVDGVNGNIIGQDPRLEPLANNGGLTPTHALLPDSPAINAGENSAVSVSLDQNGQLRIQRGTVDIGAYESEFTVVTPPLLDLQMPPLLSVEPLEAELMARERIEQFLARNQICEAVAALDQYYTQQFNQHLGQFKSQEPMSCAELQQRLPADAALLYVFAQTDELHLISLTAQGDPSHYEVPLPKAKIVSQLTNFQQTLTNPVLRRSEQFLPIAQQLHQWIMEPVLGEFQAKGINNILFSLDEGLRTLPIAALHNGEAFLLETVQTALIPSFYLTPTHRPHLQAASVLALGISEFDELAALPGVPVEIASIKEQFPSATPVAEAQATLNNFRGQLQTQPRQIVHLATHGNFQPGNIDNSYIQFWDDQLNLRQIEGLNWSMADVELLVLSACQTALGNPSVGYGFAGLAVQAEAGAAVAGLWSANDAATMALMREFYRQLGLGQPKGEALRQAQLALLQGTVRLVDKQLVGSDKAVLLPPELQELGDRTFWHPYYWSAFTLIGNPW